MLRRCFSTWQLWWRSETGQRELLAQQQQTRRKMAALIGAASAGRLMRGPGLPGPPGPAGDRVRDGVTGPVAQVRLILHHVHSGVGPLR